MFDNTRRHLHALPVFCLAALTLSACGEGHGAGGPVPGDSEDTRPFSQIAAGDAVNAIGTEPFWRLRVERGTLTYTTPEDLDGTATQVERFAGRGGLSFSGTLGGQQLDLAITPGECSDGMSDRTYPFHATLALGTDQRSGCAWRDTDDVQLPGEAAGQ